MDFELNKREQKRFENMMQAQYGYGWRIKASSASVDEVRQRARELQGEEDRRCYFE